MRIAKGWTSAKKLAGVVGIPYSKLVELTKQGKFPLGVNGKGAKGTVVVEQGKLRKALGLPEGLTGAAPQGYVGLRQAAKQLGVTPESLYMAARRKLLKTATFGGVLHTTAADLEQWEKGRKLGQEIREMKFRLARLERTRRALAKQAKIATVVAVHAATLEQMAPTAQATTTH